MADIKRSYVFHWYPLKDAQRGKKEPIIRKNTITPTLHLTGETPHDAHVATEIFVQNFGNLKKNIIMKIQELDENGEQIGQDIIPLADYSIIPTRK